MPNLRQEPKDLAGHLLRREIILAKRQTIKGNSLPFAIFAGC
ncbi:hypothetical protein BH24BAC1_BH24BAC1_35540 [soil metagenome]